MCLSLKGREFLGVVVLIEKARSPFVTTCDLGVNSRAPSENLSYQVQANQLNRSELYFGARPCCCVCITRAYRLLQQSLSAWLLVQWVWPPHLLPSRHQEVPSWSCYTQTLWTLCRGNLLSRPPGNRDAQCGGTPLQGVLSMSHRWVNNVSIQASLYVMTVNLFILMNVCLLKGSKGVLQ